MTTERIDIEVTDKVASTIPTKLRDIAAHAEKGVSALARLKNALAALPTSQLAALSAGANSSSNTIKSLTNIISGLEARLSTAAAAANEADSALTRVASAASAAGKAMGTVGAGAGQSTSKLNAASGAARTYATAMHGVSASTGLAGHQMGNLTAQLNDIGVSLAGGQNPLLVLIQQGSQIQYLASTVEGGFKTLLKATTALVIGQQQVSNAATQTAAANLASASAATTAATAQAAQAGTAANLVIAEQAVTAAQTQAGASAAALAIAEANVSAAQAAVTRSAVPTTAALAALNTAKLASAEASAAATIANAELAAAHVSLATSAEAAARAELQLAQASAGTALGLGVIGAALVGLGAVLAPLGVKFKQFHDQLNADGAIKDYVATLGLTKKELKDLEDQTITYGDMASGVWATIKEGAAGLNPLFEAIGAGIMFVIDLVYNTLKNFSFGLQALFKGTYRAVITIWNQFPAAFGDLFARAANVAISSLEWIANKAVEVLNYLGGSFESVTLKRMENANAGAAGRMGADLMAGYTDAFAEAEKGYNAFVDRVGKNTTKAARDRLKKGAADIISDRSEGSKKTGKDPATTAAEKRAQALAQVNLQLDNEIDRMRLLKDARAIEQRMDQITEALAQKKIKLSTDEAAAIRAKVVEIERFRYVQSEMDRILEAAVGPQRTLNASTEAASLLYKQGAIDLQTYNAELEKASRTYAEATDPLFRFNEQLAVSSRLVGLYGVELEKANYLEEIRQEYANRGLSMYDATTGKLRAEVTEIIRKNDALRQQQQIQSQLGAVLNPILDQQNEIASEQALYTELQRLRDVDLINEDAYQQAKTALWLKYNDMRLSATSDFFGALASATKDGHGAVGAISKAAAVAQATIDGYVAVQKALASAPPPFNYIAAAAVAVKTGTQVAGIMSTNVGSYKDGGQFTVGGRSGVDANNINMNVTKGERVTIETAKQQRANDNQASGEPVVNANTKVVNLFDEKSFVGAMDSDEGERVVMNIIRRNPGGIQAALNR